MNKTIQHLAEICRQYRFKEKLLFVPSYSIGHQLVEHLAKAEGSWINLRVTTIAGCAQELVALELSKDSLRLINSQELIRQREWAWNHGIRLLGSKGHRGRL